MLVAWQLLVHPLNATFQWIFFAALVFIIGVPHGALDLYVQQMSDQLSGKTSRTFIFLAKYCSLIIMYAVAWYLFPVIAFLLFLIISCIHFGETDTRYFSSSAANNKAVGFLYGAALLAVLLLPHFKEVTVVLQQLLPRLRQLPAFIMFVQKQTPLILGISILTLVTIVVIRLAEKNMAGVVIAPLLLAVLLACCSVLPLLPAFALYFVGWHSIISLQQVGMYIKSGNTKYNHQNFVLPLLKKGLPFSALAMSGLIIACFLFQHFSLSVKPLPVVLIFLSLITLPHLQVMNELNKHIQ